MSKKKSLKKKMFPRQAVSAERKLREFTDLVTKKPASPILEMATPGQKPHSRKTVTPSRSRRLATQGMSHIPTSKRREFLVMKKLGFGASAALNVGTTKEAYDGIYNDLEHLQHAQGALPCQSRRWGPTAPAALDRCWRSLTTTFTANLCLSRTGETCKPMTHMLLLLT